MPYNVQRTGINARKHSVNIEPLTLEQAEYVLVCLRDRFINEGDFEMVVERHEFKISKGLRSLSYKIVEVS